MNLSVLSEATRAAIIARRILAKRYGHWNYVATFDTGRVKVGVTNDPEKRFSYYAQEARRHDIGDVDFFAFGGHYTRPEVLWVERSVCVALSLHRVIGNREWFVGDLDRSHDAQCLTVALQSEVMQGFPSHFETPQYDSKRPLGARSTVWLSTRPFGDVQ